MKFYTNTTSTNKIYFQIGPNKYWGVIDNNKEIYFAGKANIIINKDKILVIKDNIDISEKYQQKIELVKKIWNHTSLSMLIKGVKNDI